MLDFLEEIFATIVIIFLITVFFCVPLVVSEKENNSEESTPVETNQDTTYCYKLIPQRYGLDTLCIPANRMEVLKVDRVILGEVESAETEYLVFLKDNKIQSSVSKFDYAIE